MPTATADDTEVDVPDDRFEPVRLLVSAFSISSLGGLAALLRSQRKLTLRAVVSAILYSGLTGLIIALLWYNHFGGNNPYFLLGVSGLAGIGGATVMDFFVQLLKSGKIWSLIKILTAGRLNITISTESKSDIDVVEPGHDDEV